MNFKSCRRHLHILSALPEDIAISGLNNFSHLLLFEQVAQAVRNESNQTGEAVKAQRAAAELLLHCGANGVAGDWEIRLDTPSAFLWDSWLLPKADRLAVQNDGGTARILSSLDGVKSESRLHWSPEQGGWLTDDLKQLTKVADGAYSMSLLLGESAPSLNADGPVLEQISQANHESLSQSLKLLRESVPRYHTWVTRVLRRLIIIESPQNILRSGNKDGHYGTFYISECLDPLLIGEMLVHESSHQYFHALIHLEDVADTSDQTMYYSPFVKRERTLDRLVLAYHAFANVYLYYRECFNSQAYSQQDRKGLATVDDDINVVEQTIMESDKLTPLGRALVEPLYREMHYA